MDYTVKIHYHHTDAGGVVYYGNYLAILEEARTDFLARKGVSVQEWIGKGRYFVVSRQEMDYRSPARYGDILTISTTVNGVSAVRIDLTHSIRNQHGTPVAGARTVLAFIDTNFKPSPIPADMRALLTGEKDRYA